MGDISENYFVVLFYQSRFTTIWLNEKDFLQDNYIIPVTHPLCATRKLFNFLASISNISLPSVHHLNTREYIYVKILSTSRVQHLNSSKKFTRKNNPTKIELFSI